MKKVQPTDYTKGDNRAGGGGGVGGGGKQTRRTDGWEKGDVARQVADLRPGEDFPHKPGRASVSEVSEEPEPELPILDALHRTNAKLLTTMRKLDTTHTPDECSTLLDYVERMIALKREIESRLIPLLDDRNLVDSVEQFRRLDAFVDRELAALRSTPPRGPAFSLAVETLRGTLEQQVQLERDAFEPDWISELDPEQATDLARDIHA
jgi:hypothetical protein